MGNRTRKQAADRSGGRICRVLVLWLCVLALSCACALGEGGEALPGETGALTVAVAPLEGMDEDPCQVTVTLLDARVNGTYGEAVFAFGRAVLELSGGEEAVIPGLPAGTVYTVTEREGRADVLYPQEESPHRIPEGETALVTLERPENTLGRLRLTCTQTGRDADPDGMYHFLIRTDADTLNGRFGDLTFKNGAAEILMKAGETCVAPGLPDGTRYQITCEGLKEDTAFNCAGDTGILRGGRESRASFVFAGQSGGLFLRLNCEGNDPDPGRTFRIKVELKDETGNTWTSWHMDPFRAGKATLPMTDGELTCLDIPDGAVPQITAEDLSGEGFETACVLKEACGGKEAHVTYVRNTFGGIRIAALASGIGEAPENPRFTLTLNDDSLSGRFGDLLMENGVSSNGNGSPWITLEKGRTLWVTGIPNGTEYTLGLLHEESGRTFWQAENSRGMVTGTPADTWDTENLIRIQALETAETGNENAPETEDGRVTLRGRVCLLDGTLEEGQFSFAALEDGEEAARAACGADGSFALRSAAPLTEGTHTWIVRQEARQADAILQDLGERKITFRLEKDAEGQVQAALAEGSEPLLFANRLTLAQLCARTASGSRTFGTLVTVKDEAEKTVARWRTDGGVHSLYGLKAGAYTWETADAQGVFEITLEGALLQDGRQCDTVVIGEKEEPCVGLIKTDTEGNALSGAVIEVRDRCGDVRDSWTTDVRVHWINGLTDGETYSIVETRPAEGYVKWKGEMTLRGGEPETDLSSRTEDGAVILTLRTEKPAVRIQLLDAETGENVPGAVFVVTDEQGEETARWTGGEGPFEVTGLRTLREYTLTEEAPAPGYGAAEGPRSFALDENGRIETDGDWTGWDLIPLYSRANRLTVARTDADSGEALSGAVLVLTDGQGQVLKEWVSDGEPYLLRGLETGLRGTVTEKTPPEGYCRAEAAAIEQTAGEAAQVVLSSQRTRVTFLRTDENGTEIPEGGKYHILDENGTPLEGDALSGREIVGLRAGKWTLTEEVPPDGYVRARETVFEVLPDGSVEGEVILGSAGTALRVTARDKADGRGIANVRIQALDGEGTVCAEAVTEASGAVLRGLRVETPYRLRTLTDGTGYLSVEDVPFELDGDGIAPDFGEEGIPLALERQSCEMLITNLVLGEPPAYRFAFRIEMRLEGERWAESCRYAVLNRTGEVVSQGALTSGVMVECGADETIRVSGIPVGTAYTLTEKNHSGYYCLVSVNGGRASMTETARGTLTDPDRTEMVVFTNSRPQ